MIGKRAWLTIPTLLLPYCTLFTLATIFLSTKTSFFKFVMESVFGGSAIYLFLALFIYCLLAAVLSAVYFIDSIYKKRDALFLAKYFMIVKLIQVPGYVLIFVLGVLCAITILTIPFSIALFFIDCFSFYNSRNSLDFMTFFNCLKCGSESTFTVNKDELITTVEFNSDRNHYTVFDD